VGGGLARQRRDVPLIGGMGSGGVLKSCRGVKGSGGGKTNQLKTGGGGNWEGKFGNKRKSQNGKRSSFMLGPKKNGHRGYNKREGPASPPTESHAGKNW